MVELKVFLVYERWRDQVLEFVKPAFRLLTDKDELIRLLELGERRTEEIIYRYLVSPFFLAFLFLQLLFSILIIPLCAVVLAKGWEAYTHATALGWVVLARMSMTIEEGLQLCLEVATGHRQAQTSQITTLFSRRRPREKRLAARIIAYTAFLILVASPTLAAHSPPTALCAQTVKGILWSVPSPTFLYAHIQRVRCSGHSASPTFASEL
uniref:Uncharacterized protein n=1 Tax=Chromera velia CCMP2878 TaxID=1169474 RepID=A0A0G4GZ07_9ALVE|eukprot:Cvel_23988.t1-p1 / transcript=Cvel_23988.t1 / gene=Cvel_23988 / organism=Chromera_velia_CCMP2878 / gene_product=hypothetical protein / transcript_product=hypothetical protein / location=Cvel_scaffold2542:6201-6827(+) / protein_length=209 / sequence_SO=supercontig / SO=protein_coding / is_pseudo=false